MSLPKSAPPPCRACACERDGVCNHGSPHTCGFATRAEAQAECDAANEPLSDEQIIAAAALDWNMRQPRARGPRKVTVTTYFEPRQIDALRALSARTRAPVAVHMREAVEQYLKAQTGLPAWWTLEGAIPEPPQPRPTLEPVSMPGVVVNDAEGGDHGLPQD